MKLLLSLILALTTLCGYFHCPLSWSEKLESFSIKPESSIEAVTRPPLLSSSAPTSKINNKTKVEIPLLTLNGNALTLPGVVNRSEIGMFIIDTGASNTVITPAVAARLGIPISQDTPKVPILTANGTVLAPVVIIQEIFMGRLRIVEVQAVVLDLGENKMLIGLLGMDVLGKLDYAIQSDKLTVSH